MALLEEQFTETLNAGAPDITYEGDEGREQQIAQALWDRLPPQARMQFGSFQQFFTSGAWKQVLQMLQQQIQGQEGPQERIQETETIQTQPQQGIASMMPAQMANGGRLMASASDPMDDKNQISLSLFGKPLHELNPEEEMQLDDWLEDKAQKWQGAYGGIAGADGRRQYGIGSWFQKKIMDPIKKNIVPIAAIAGGAALNKWGLPGGGAGQGWFTDLLKKGTLKKGLGSVLKDPKWMIPAASLVAGAFAKPEQALEGGVMSRGAGINLQDIAKLANITDEQQGQAIGLNFLPEASARKYSPEEMALTYSLAGKAHGGRIRAQEGGLMNLGGMEKDYRNDGGFVPIGGEEKADDVPARLSRNEFVFTADAVRNAGGGDIDAGAEVMENVMKNLEGGGTISDESQGKGAGEMFEVSERLSEVV